MKEISKLQLISLTGGWIDPVKCQEVQEEAAELPHCESPDDHGYDQWEKWLERYDKYCGGSNI